MSDTDAGRPGRTRTASPRFVVRRSATGLGLFAVRPIEAGKRLIEYTGPRLTLAQARKLGGRYLMEVADDRYIDGSGRDNLARYVNHSCRPNCQLSIERGRVWIRSTTAIAEGEELSYDYGEDYMARLFGPGGCKCPSCRAAELPSIDRAASSSRQRRSREGASSRRRSRD